jgi:hypothetical protein
LHHGKQDQRRREGAEHAQHEIRGNLHRVQNVAGVRVNGLLWGHLLWLVVRL